MKCFSGDLSRDAPHYHCRAKDHEDTLVRNRVNLSFWSRQSYVTFFSPCPLLSSMMSSADAVALTMGSTDLPESVDRTAFGPSFGPT